MVLDLVAQGLQVQVNRPLAGDRRAIAGNWQAPAHHIVRLIHRVMGFGSVSLNLFDVTSGHVQLVAHLGPHQESLPQRDDDWVWTNLAVFGPSAYGRYRAGRFCYLIPRAAVDGRQPLGRSPKLAPPAFGTRPAGNGQGRARWQPGDVLCVLIDPRHGHTIGLVLIERPPDGRHPSKATIRALDSLAALAAPALERAVWGTADPPGNTRQPGVESKRPLATPDEKEVLLQEVHHRVKNNLQVISSLLYLQAGEARDESVRSMFRDSQNRVRSMALIHEKLYEAHDLARIDFSDYARDLATSLIRSYAGDAAVKLKTDVNGVFLSLDKAIPCGLIINELVSNALEHAFPHSGANSTHAVQGLEPQIRIALCPIRDRRLMLVVADNGIGFPAGLDFHKATSLGLQLVHTLVEQLDGTVSLHGHAGTEFRIEFPVS